jgi:hypothetical protein
MVFRGVFGQKTSSLNGTGNGQNKVKIIITMTYHGNLIRPTMIL